jgi:hypothetical protein
MRDHGLARDRSDGSRTSAPTAAQRYRAWVTDFTQQIAVALPDDAIEALTATAATEATSLSAVVRRIVLAELRRRQPEPVR